MNIIQKLAILASMIIMIIIPALIVPVYSLTTEDIDRNDRECINRAYEIGYNITETSKNQTEALLKLEGDCIYSPTVSLDNVWNLPDYVVDFKTDLSELYVEQSGYLNQCTNLDSL